MARTTDVLILGAGMSGAAAALTLKSMNFKVQVIDKSRGFGGRMATRRISESYFDHGAQFIKPSPLFFDWLDAHLPRGFLKEWISIESKKTFIVPRGMNTLAKELLDNIPVDLNIEISKISRKNSKWIIADNEGHSYSAPQLLITAPLPQALNLLDRNKIEYDNKLKDIIYRPCIALLANLNTLPKFSNHLSLGDPVIEEIFDNKSKGLSCDSSAITLFCTEKFSKENYDLEDDKIYSKILNSLSKYDHIFDHNLKIKEYQIKKWRYGKPVNFYSHMYYKSLSSGLYLTGDAFGGASLDGAFRSGLSVSYIIKDDIIY